MGLCCCCSGGGGDDGGDGYRRHREGSVDRLTELEEQMRRAWQSRWDTLLTRVRRRKDGSHGLRDLGGLDPSFPVIAQLYAHRDVVQQLYDTYDFSPGQSRFYVPELANFLLHGRFDAASALEVFLLDKSERSTHYAHRLYWFMLAFERGVEYESKMAGAVTSGVAEAMPLLVAIERQGCGAADRMIKALDSVVGAGERWRHGVSAVSTPTGPGALPVVAEAVDDAAGEDESKASSAEAASSEAKDGALEGGEGGGGSSSSVVADGAIFAYADAVVARASAGCKPGPFHEMVGFVDELEAIAVEIGDVPVPQRNDRVRVLLAGVNDRYLPSRALYVPVGNPHNVLLAIHPEESFCFKTKERAPMLMTLEVVDYATRDGEPLGTKSPAAGYGATDSGRRKSKHRRARRSRTMSVGGFSVDIGDTKITVPRRDFHLHAPFLSSDDSFSSDEEKKLTHNPLLDAPPPLKLGRHQSSGIGMWASPGPAVATDKDRLRKLRRQRKSFKDGEKKRLLRADSYGDGLASGSDDGADEDGMMADDDESFTGGLSPIRLPARVSTISETDLQTPGSPKTAYAAFPSSPATPGTTEKSVDRSAVTEDSWGGESPASIPAPGARGASGSGSGRMLGTPSHGVGEGATTGKGKRSRVTSATDEEFEAELAQQFSADEGHRRISDIEEDAHHGHSDDGLPRLGSPKDIARPMLEGDAIAKSRGGAEESKSSAGAASSVSSAAPVTVVFKEKWAAKEDRIRETSRYSHLPGWRLMPVIYKSNDDLRQEQFAAQMIKQFDSIFRAAKLPLWMRPYDILATSSSSGLIECIPDTISIDSLKQKDKNYTTLDDFFVRFFGKGNRKSAKLKAARKNFVSSLAAYSIVCYVLQIKDRHNGNILVDADGHICHIDFGFLLSNSPGGIRFERAPFKLTDEFVEVMGGNRSDLFLKYRALCVRAFLEIRKHSERITLLVEMMLEGNEKLPCFAGGHDMVVNGLRDRLALHANSRACATLVNSLINQSLNNWHTRCYDRFQYHCVGVY